VTDTPKRSGALDLFIAGATVRQIAERLTMTPAAVEKAIRGGLGAASKQRVNLAAETKLVLAERVDALFRAHFPQALRGDHRSAEVCRRMIEQQVWLSEMDAARSREKGDILDEIAQRRASRRAGAAKGAARPKRSG
jgi:predicted transcriptional regulator